MVYFPSGSFPKDARPAFWPLSSAGWDVTVEITWSFSSFISKVAPTTGFSFLSIFLISTGRVSKASFVTVIVVPFEASAIDVGLTVWF